MEETYCGKNCQECTRREELDCPGCKTGPGRAIGGDCDLAGCIRSKGHETCDSCSFRPTCGLMRGREEMPTKRLRKWEYEQYKRERIARKAPVLGKWLGVLFWLIVPSTIASLMSYEKFREIAPQLYLAGCILKGLVSAVYGLILLRLGFQESRYRTAGICWLITAGISLLLTFMSNVGAILLLSLPGVVLGLVAEYHEFMGHSEVLIGVDQVLSDRWSALWKWNIGIHCALIGSIILLLIIPLLGALFVLAAAIGLVVVGILKLVWLYHTAKTFREYLYRVRA